MHAILHLLMRFRFTNRVMKVFMIPQLYLKAASFHCLVLETWCVSARRKSVELKVKGKKQMMLHRLTMWYSITQWACHSMCDLCTSFSDPLHSTSNLLVKCSRKSVSSCPICESWPSTVTPTFACGCLNNWQRWTANPAMSIGNFLEGI